MASKSDASQQPAHAFPRSACQRAASAHWLAGSFSRRHAGDAASLRHSKRGVIHRDIKPANILIDHEGHIKVADFGLAKMHDPAPTSGLTHSSVGLGTPDYVAPEVLSHGVAADHRADIYAVGVMLYQMLTGEVPRGMFKLPSQKGIGSDPRFDEIISKAMEQDRDERYQSAMDVRRALDEIKTTPLAREDGTGILPVKSGKPKPSSARRKSLIIGGIVPVLAVAVFLILSDKTKAPSSPTSESFRRAVAAASPEQQVALVVAKINEINHTEINSTPTIMDGKVTALHLTKKTATGPAAPDVSPVAALRDLTSLSLMYLNVADISCLRELRLKDLTIHSGTFTDLSVLKELPLTNLCLRGSMISDFAPLANAKLTRLDLGSSPRLKDISFIKGMPLIYLSLDTTPVTDFSPIAGLPIEELFVNPDTKLDAALLRSLPALKTINNKPVAAYRQ